MPEITGYPPGWSPTECNCEPCRNMRIAADRDLLLSNPWEVPAGQMYASVQDDPAYFCQCDLCRATRAGTDELRNYGADGFDQFGYDSNGYDRESQTHEDVHECVAGEAIASVADLDLSDIWSNFRWKSDAQSNFLAHLHSIVNDPDEVDELKFCDMCCDPTWDDDLNAISGDSEHVCESCYGTLSDCDCCEYRFRDSDLYSTLGGSEICESCRNDNYTYCEYCDGYYHNDDSGEHHHGDGGCCDSPQLEFAIRNDGCEPLRNDTRVTITLPAGTISAEGLKEIKNYLYMFWYNNSDDYAAYRSLSYDLEILGDKWQTKDGNYTKRLSRHGYKAHGVKLPPEVISRVGCIASAHSTQVDVDIDVTRELNNSAEYFFHEDSCWWGSYSESRCALKTNGGFGLRSLTGPYGYASGRAWVLPLKQNENGALLPTFDTRAAAAFVIFNGYGELDGYTAPRILAHMTGWTYRKIRFSADPMYINAGGYLVAPEEIAEKYTDGSLSLNTPQHAHLYESERTLVSA